MNPVFLLDLRCEEKDR